MLRILLKKQIFELLRGILYDKKHNTMRSGGAVAGFIALFLFVFASAAFAFVGMSVALSPLFDLPDTKWVFFAFMGTVAVVIGVMGSVFITVNSLYHARDNDLLLSMPVSVNAILVSRLLTVYLMDAVFVAVVLFPSTIYYFIHVPQTALTVVSAILFYVLVTLLVLALCCALGWVVARISTHVRNKSVVTTVLTVVFLSIYYVIYFNINTLLSGFVTNIVQNGVTITPLLEPLYRFGRAGAGDGIALAGLAVLVLALVALVGFLLNRSFIRIVTTSTAGPRSREELTTEKITPVRRALRNRELKHFVSSAAYMTNCGIGLLFLPAVGIFSLFKGPDLTAALDKAGLIHLLPGLAATALMFLMSTNDITAPSVSLEGKSLWIAQTLPVRPEFFLRAKLETASLLTLPSMLLSVVLLSIGLRLSWLDAILLAALGTATSLFLSALGLALNLRNPDFQWTNEIYPIKQSMPVMVSIFGGMGLAIVVGGLCVLGGFLFGPVFGQAAAAFFAALLTLVSLLLRRWIYEKGAAQFAQV
ncbi:MAG: hypothetical protein KIG36_02170 [Eubacteriales bacterium]|nr:hypothetical protein [Eubacteriales bacterium]